MKKIADLSIGDSFYYEQKLLKITGNIFSTNAGNSFIPVEHDGRRYEFRCTSETLVDAVK